MKQPMPFSVPFPSTLASSRPATQVDRVSTHSAAPALQRPSRAPSGRSSTRTIVVDTWKQDDELATREFIHRPIGEEVRAISGSYTLEKEMKLPHADREVLVVLGHAFIDSSCCGVAGCRYAFVPGYLFLPIAPAGGAEDSGPRHARPNAGSPRDLLGTTPDCDFMSIQSRCRAP